MERRRDREMERKGEEEVAIAQSPSRPSVPSSLRPSVPPSTSLPIALRRLFDRILADEVFGRAAQLAYYWLFSLFPLLIFLTALLAYLPLHQRPINGWPSSAACCH